MTFPLWIQLQTTASISHLYQYVLPRIEEFQYPLKLTEPLNALIDCGAEGLFIDKKIASNWTKKNIQPIRVRNVDGTENVDGRITEKCLITFYICGKRLTEWFYVTVLGDQSLILGLPWLEKHNPIIDWADKTLEF